MAGYIVLAPEGIDLPNADAVLGDPNNPGTTTHYALNAEVPLSRLIPGQYQWLVQQGILDPAGSGFGGGENLLDNGAMQIHQRGTSKGSIGSVSGLYYTADRWSFYNENLGTWTQSVADDAPTGSGFRKSLKMTIDSGAESPNPSAEDYVRVVQAIEGQNLQSVRKGTADAQPLTVSFWVKSNKTGTYIAELYDLDNTRSVSASYTINASATWEQKSITFPADTTGAFDNDNAASMSLVFHLADGSNFTSGTLATSWAAVTPANRAAGQVNLADTNANYWQITGVQLETGPSATNYQFKNYGQELAECQRYYYASPASVVLVHNQYNSGNTSSSVYTFPVVMRGTPVVTVYDDAGTVNKLSWAANGGSITNNTAIPNMTVNAHFWGWGSGGMPTTSEGFSRQSFVATADL